MSEFSNSDSSSLPSVRANGPTESRTRRAPRKPNPAPAPQQQFSPKFLLWVVATYWRIAVPCGVVLAGAATAGLLYTYVPNYKAVGVIRIEEVQPFIAFPRAEVGSSGERFVRTQIETMRSSMILQKVLADPAVAKASHLSKAKDRLEKLKEGLSIQQVGGSELYSISYVCPSPVEASDVVTAIINHYFQSQEYRDVNRIGHVVELLNAAQESHQSEVERLQRDVVELSREVTGKDPFGHNQIIDVSKAVSPLGSLHQQITDIEVEIEIATAELAALEGADVVHDDPADRSRIIDLQVNSHPEVRAQTEFVAAMENQLRSYEERLKNWQDDERYLQLSESLSDSREQLDGLRTQVKELLLAERRTRFADEGKSLSEIKRSELRTLQVRRDVLLSRFKDELAKVQQGGESAAELEFAQAALAREEKVFEMIAARKLALQTESKAPPRIELHGDVLASAVPLEAAPWSKIVLACCVSLAAPFGLAFGKEIALRRITDAEQLHAETQLDVLGEIPSFPVHRLRGRLGRLPKRLRKRMFTFAESIDAARIALNGSSPQDACSVVAVTSAVTGEGKTSVAVALAMSCANASQRPTLIIDADLRDPSVDQHFELEEGPGLSELLRLECKLSEAIQATSTTNHLYVLRAGSRISSPHHVVQRQKLHKLFSHLRGRFATIIVDTPPTLGASESLGICGESDYTVICARRGHSRVRQIVMSADKLDAAGARIAGAVLNDVPSSDIAYHYDYGYGFASDAVTPSLVNNPS